MTGPRARGRLIALEGPDGTGTTTQAGRLKAALEERGLLVHTTCEPSSLPVGKLIRERLGAGVSTEAGWRALALMFAADRLDHVEREIEPALDEGRWVITDRYALSSLVYQSLHAETAWVRELNRFARPADLTLVVTLPLDEALARIASRGGQAEAYDQRAFQERVHALYAELGRAERAAFVDGSGSPAEVTGRLLARIDEEGIG